MRSTGHEGLFFFHNPKAGGTAVDLLLRAMFAPQTCCPLIENSQRDHEQRAGAYEAFRGYGYYGGHYGYDIFNAVADGHNAVTNFRTPDRRLLSLYNYYRLDVTLPEDPAGLDALYPVAFAKDVDFHSFIASDDPRIEIYTRNFHVRQLTNSPWQVGTDGDLAHAIQLVDRMPWFYLCEQPELSDRWGRMVFRNPLFSTELKNVTSVARNELVAVATIKPVTRRLLMAKNEADYALYTHARGRLDRIFWLARPAARGD
jgi:hypothetical protein